jgi:CheY-like chemotaxis protein
MNGFELCDRLTADGAPFPIIFITAHDDAGTRERASDRRVAGYLTKPVSRLTLLEAIGSSLRGPGASPSGSSDPPATP